MRVIKCARCGEDVFTTGPRTKYCLACATKIRIENQNKRRSGGLKDGAPHTKHITCEICGKDVVVSTKAARARYCPECAAKAFKASTKKHRTKEKRWLLAEPTTEDISSEELTPRDKAFMKDLYELMEKEIADVDLDITRISEMMRMSRTKFYYKVKGLTGENPSAFFKRYKLNFAANLLKEGKYNMSEIAYMTGFNTLSHFSASFKKQFGVPPSEYIG